MMNKYTMFLLAIILMAGGIFGIRQVPKSSIPYKSIEKCDCGIHYNVTTYSNNVYHVAASQIDSEHKRISVYKPGRLFLIVMLYIIYGIYVFFQLRVWICKPNDFCTDFFYEWCEACHRPPSEEFIKPFRTFLGLE